MSGLASRRLEKHGEKGSKDYIFHDFLVFADKF